MTSPFYVPPEQLTKERAEFARKGIARGRPIAVCAYVDGVLLIGENPSGSLHKLGEIYDRIAFAGVGRFNEFEMLRTAGVRYADIKGYSYGRMDVTARGLANAYSQTLGQIFIHELKPYEIELMVAEMGSDSHDGTNMFRIQFDGTLAAMADFGAMGGNDAKVTEVLAAGWAPSSTWPGRCGWRRPPSRRPSSTPSSRSTGRRRCSTGPGAVASSAGSPPTTSPRRGNVEAP